MIITACHRCTERHVGCHSTCDRYREQREELDRIRAEQHKDALISSAVIERVLKTIDHVSKRRGR